MTDFFTPEEDRRSAERQIDPALPSVLLLGDSISQGYTPPVRSLLAGRCNVLRPRANCGDTRAGLEHLDVWLGGKRWDLVHFNWGLHDLCYRHPESTVYGHRDKVKGTISVPPETYGQNLGVLVQRMKPAAGRLVWASTTVVPPGEAGRFEGDEVRYNRIATAIMAAHGIPVDDLHALTASFAPSLFTAPGDVHFTAEGYLLIARQVAACIGEQLGLADEPG